MSLHHPELAVLGKVFKTKALEFIQPKFEFKFTNFETESYCTFTPPIRYSKRPCIETAHLYISSDTGIITVTPFEVGNPNDKTEANVLGGVVIGYGGEENIILAVSERFLPNQTPIHSLNLLKVHEKDLSIFVRPALKKNGATPLPVYQLENQTKVFGISRIGLGIFTNGISITHKNNRTLIETKTI